MKKICLSVLILTLCVTVFSACQKDPLTVPVVDDSGNTRTAIPSITVTGESEITLTPDMASISFGIQLLEKESATAAMDKAAKALASVEDALRTLGVKDEDMQTSQFSLYESYKYDNNGNRSNKPLYNVSNILTINIYDIDRIGVYIDEAINAGANNVYGIQFSLKDLKAQETDALTQALENARRRAEALAAAEGKKLGTILMMNDGTQISEEVYTDYQNTAMKTEAMDLGDTRSMGTSIQPGSLKVNGRVSVRFAME